MIVTLLSDFGRKDHYVAKIKGILLQNVPLEHIVDISHEITPFSLLNAAYVLKNAYTHFPKNTIHISLMQIMDNMMPAKAVLYASQGQYLISAENALLPIMFHSHALQVYELPVSANSYMQWIEQVSKLLAQWQQQPEWLQAFETKQLNIEVKTAGSIINEDRIEAHVLYVDQYQNVIFNLTQEQFNTAKRDRSFEIMLRTERIRKLSNTYHDVASGSLLARFNSDGYLEIAIRNDKAAQLLGLQVLETGKVFYNIINIIFNN